ncbi:hypothetical protein [Streptomyces sp. TRM49041]|uniref:hypothetical protein n=1 Tax=Streptomyces sp. TRM49041 TaxID=2603216 RepID=UPI0011EF84EC|nr:hypothetical protein [Streptomyces sp. TRM49041]
MEQTVPVLINFVIGEALSGNTVVSVVGHSSRLEIERPQEGEATRYVVCAHHDCGRRLRVRILGPRETRARRRTLWRRAALAGLAAIVSWTLMAVLLGLPSAVFFGLAAPPLAVTAVILAFRAHGHLGISQPDEVLTRPHGGRAVKGRHVIV